MERINRARTAFKILWIAGQFVRNSELIELDIKVTDWIYDVDTGRADLVVEMMISNHIHSRHLFLMSELILAFRLFFTQQVL